MKDEPKRPELTRAEQAWLDSHVPRGMSLEAVTDAPAPVQTYISALVRWREARETWAISQPIDYAPERGIRGCWRMFGGEWIGDGEQVDAVLPNGLRYVESPLRAAHEALLTKSDDEFRAWALTFYEHRRMIARAQTAMLVHLRGSHA